jgi:MFS family permease
VGTEHRQNIAIAIGAAALAAGLALGGTVVGFAIASSSLQKAGWFRPSLYVAGALSLVGLYLLVGPYLGLPVPEPRSVPIWHGWWSHLPFSRQSRIRRAKARYQKADNKLYERIQAEVKLHTFDAPRLVQSVHEALTDPRDLRSYWVTSVGVRRLHMLGFGASGNVTDVTGSTVDAPDVAERIRQFEELVTAGREWPETKERQRLLAEWQAGLE